MGFVPIAYRAGSEKKSRVHIYWQKRIRAGDNSTPYWFPAKTESRAIREDRIILPIPPGMRWADELPILLPERAAAADSVQPSPPRQAKPPHSLPPSSKKSVAVAPKPAKRISTPNGIWMAPAKPVAAPSEIQAKAQCPPRAKRVKAKADPKLIAKARELRDRWMDHVSVNGGAGLLCERGKYEVSRVIGSAGQLENASDNKRLAA